MAFLRSLSDTFWSYVTPEHQTTPPARTKVLQASPHFKKQAAPIRYNSLQDVVKASRSMSPVERVDSWRLQTSSRGSTPVTDSRKRKRTSGQSVGFRRKAAKMEDEYMDNVSEVEDTSDVSVDEEMDADDDEEVDEISEEMSNVRVRNTSPSSTPRSLSFEDDEENAIDTSLIVSETEPSPGKRKLVSPSKLHASRGVSTEELRAQGWDDDHIVLVQKIAMRGYEPIMPEHWQFAYRFHIPDSLFLDAKSDDSKAHIYSVRREHCRSMNAMEKMWGLGAWMRDRVLLQGRLKPEDEAFRTITNYIKWADRDSGLDVKTAIPLLTVIAEPKDRDAEEIKAIAKKKCAALARRYRNAFRVLQSIEYSPGSVASTQMSYPVPTIYAIVASHLLIAITAYNPEHPDIKTVGLFKMDDKDYDVWNAFALCMTVCHVRDVQMRIAEETGLGMKSGYEEKKEDAWDL